MICGRLSVSDIKSIQVEDWTPKDNSIIVNITAIGNFEYSIDRNNFQVNTVSSNLLAGDYTIFVRDKEI